MSLYTIITNMVRLLYALARTVRELKYCNSLSAVDKTISHSRFLDMR